MQYHKNCPNEACDGEVTFDVESTDDGAADIYGPSTYLVAYINDEDSAHIKGCTLTDEQRTKLEEQATQDITDDPDFGFIFPD